MIAIANVTKDWAIGRNGDLVCRISEDLKLFRSWTSGKTVIMGHSTLRSLPGGRPLRWCANNIVLIRPESELEAESINAAHEKVIPLTVAHSVEEAIQFVSSLPPDDVFVIGGGSVYEQFLPYCDKCVITVNSMNGDGADTFFPALSEELWDVIDTGLQFHSIDRVTGETVDAVVKIYQRKDLSDGKIQEETR